MIEGGRAEVENRRQKKIRRIFEAISEFKKSKKINSTNDTGENGSVADYWGGAIKGSP